MEWIYSFAIPKATFFFKTTFFFKNTHNRWRGFPPDRKLRFRPNGDVQTSSLPVQIRSVCALPYPSLRFLILFIIYIHVAIPVQSVFTLLDSTLLCSLLASPLLCSVLFCSPLFSSPLLYCALLYSAPLYSTLLFSAIFRSPTLHAWSSRGRLFGRKRISRTKRTSSGNGSFHPTMWWACGTLSIKRWEI